MEKAHYLFWPETRGYENPPTPRKIDLTRALAMFNTVPYIFCLESRRFGARSLVRITPAHWRALVCSLRDLGVLDGDEDPTEAVRTMKELMVQDITPHDVAALGYTCATESQAMDLHEQLLGDTCHVIPELTAKLPKGGGGQPPHGLSCYCRVVSSVPVIDAQAPYLVSAMAVKRAVAYGKPEWRGTS